MHTEIILAAEAAQLFREDLERELRPRGYSIQALWGGSLARTLAEQDGALALVVMDLGPCAGDGLRTLREVRRSHPQIPLIVCSSQASPSLVVEAMKAGASDFLSTPLNREQLRDSISKALEPRGGKPRIHTLLQAFEPANPHMQTICGAVQQIAVSDAPVVLRGESGVGKEVLAREIHLRSPRSSKPFLKINCAALPLELLESELFGYEKGAFTGAVRSTPGKFEIADGGVVLLDEIGDMDFKLQAKLLHVLQDNEFQRLGGRETVRVDVRVLAATHCDLERAIEEKRFREDLYYRLNVISLLVPPLRERRDEILPLAALFLKKHAVAGLRPPELTPALRQTLLRYSWPGNIRELENVIRKLLVFSDPASLAQELEARIARTQGGSPHRSSAAQPGSVFDRAEEDRRLAEAKAIVSALNRTHWNRKEAARLLKIDYKGLLYKIRKLGIGAEPSASPGVAEQAREHAAGFSK